MRSSPERTTRVIKAAWLKETRSAAGAAVAPVRTPAPQAPEPAPVSEHVLAVARQVAQATLTAAQRDAEMLRETAARDARQAGFAQGQTEGYTEGLRLGREEADRIVRDASREAQEILRRAHEQVGQLACEIAAHLLGVELRLNPEVVERAVLAILQEIPTAGPVSIEVSSVDYQQALEALPRLQTALGGQAADMRITEDRSLPQGGVRVTGPHGIVERNWQEGLLAISDAFEEVAKRGL